MNRLRDHSLHLATLRQGSAFGLWPPLAPLLALSSVLACGSTGAESGAESMVVSDSGHYLIEISGTELHRGENQIELCVVEADSGESVNDLDLEMRPFMPAMAHGSSQTTSSTALGNGCYVFDGVVLNMPGTWELRTTIEGSDFAAPKFYLD